jgi:hypothetical protein
MIDGNEGGEVPVKIDQINSLDIFVLPSMCRSFFWPNL